ncbi:MAG: hypothetical protein ACMUJM_06915 [bacterium]
MKKRKTSARNYSKEAVEHKTKEIVANRLNPERIAFLLLLFVFIFSIVFSGGGFSYHVKSFKAFCAMLATGVLLIIFLLYTPKLTTLVIPKPVLFFILYLGSIHLPLLYKSQAYDTRYYLGLYVIGILLFILIPTGFHFLFPDSLEDTQKFSSLFLEYFSYLLLIISLFGIAEYFHLFSFNPTGELVEEIKVTFGNANYLGNFLIMSFPLVLSFALITRNRLKQALSIVIIFLMLISGKFTGSRNTLGISLLIIPFFLYGYYHFIVKNWMGLGELLKYYTRRFVIGFSICAFFCSFFYLFNKKNVLGFIKRALVSRSPALITALGIWMRTPLEFFFGHGSGAFYALVFSHYPSNFRQMGVNFRSFKHVHSELLEMLVEGGLVAGILYGIFIFLIVFTLYRAMKQKSFSREIRIFAYGLFWGIIGHILFGSLSLGPRMPSSLFFFYFLIALSLMYCSSTKIHLSSGGKISGRKILWIVMLLILFSCPGIQLTRNFLSEHYHFQTAKYDIFSILQEEAKVKRELNNTPHNQKLNAMRDKITYYRKDYEKNLERTFIYNSNNIYALYALLIYEHYIGDSERFLKTFEHINSLIPHYRNTDYICSHFYLGRGDLSAALKYLDIYLEQDTFFESGLVEKTIILLLQNKKNEADLCLAELIENDLVLKGTNWNKTHEYKFGENPAGKYLKITEKSATGEQRNFALYYTDFFKGVTLSPFKFNAHITHLNKQLGQFYIRLGIPELAYDKYFKKVSEPEIKKLLIEYYLQRYKTLQAKINEEGENEDNLSSMRSFLIEYQHVFQLTDEKNFSAVRSLFPQLESILSTKKGYFLNLSSVLKKLGDYRSAWYYQKKAF